MGTADASTHIDVIWFPKMDVFRSRSRQAEVAIICWPDKSWLRSAPTHPLAVAMPENRMKVARPSRNSETPASRHAARIKRPFSFGLL